ncbi:MAG: 4-alpha-glucanotransferase [Clostridia bacterium]|nr:4-alpha-glucanotransferase [Clostridia bacterium]
MKREAGILLSITSLSSPYGIGCMSAEVFRFVDFLRDSGQRVWQLLPAGPTGFGDSPYQTFSSFAGNPYWIDLEELIRDGLLQREECDGTDWGQDPCRVDYGKVYEGRKKLLRLAYLRSGKVRDEVWKNFECEQKDWLEDYTLFMALKEHQGGLSWNRWEEKLRRRDPDALKMAKEELWEEIDFQKWMQFLFFHQWNRLHDYARKQEIKLLGDLPIYVAEDSADVWSHPELFLLNGDGIPLRVAGCPPDEFSPLGQLWGNPLYSWEAHENTGYEWWIGRISHARRLYDSVRLDHFRGFDAYYSIPYGAPDAREGKWEKGPGMELFRAVHEALGEGEYIAEDLGYLTDSVRKLVRDSGFAGMKILQFGLGGGDPEHLPIFYSENTVAYSGTHDNPTLWEWLSGRSEEEWMTIREEVWNFDAPREKLVDACLALLMRSRSNLCIVPIQDYLRMGEEGRMNRPGAAQGNWSWRLREDELTVSLAQKIRRLTESGRRLGDHDPTRREG